MSSKNVCDYCGQAIRWASTSDTFDYPLNIDGSAHFGTCSGVDMWKRAGYEVGEGRMMVERLPPHLEAFAMRASKKKIPDYLVTARAGVKNPWVTIMAWAMAYYSQSKPRKDCLEVLERLYQAEQKEISKSKKPTKLI